MRLAYSITPRSVNVLLKGRMRTIDNTHLNYAQIVAKLKAPAEWVAELDFEQWLLDHIDVKAFIAKFTQGTIAIGEDDQVYYQGQAIHTYAAERLIDMMRNGFDISPLAYFIERLMSNPETGVQKDLFTWLEAGNMPLTSDGCFLAFKKVDDNYRSYHSGPDEHCDHRIGKRPTMERSLVNNDRQQTCERGLHFCSYAYLNEYYGGSGHVVILKIAPEDVVAIPYDYNDTKGRAWTYDVVGEVPEDEARQFFHSPVVRDYDPPVPTDGMEREMDDDEVELHDEEVALEDDVCDCADCRDDAEPGAPGDNAVHDDGGEEWPQLADVIDKHIAEVEQKEISAAVAAEKKKALTFEHNGQKFSPKKIEKEVDKLGQRGFAAKYNVARSTVQGWLKKLRS